MADTKVKSAIQSGEFLIKETKCDDIFSPDEWTEQQEMIADTCRQFIQTEIIPHLDRLDAQEEGLMHSKIKKAGDLGLLSISVPEEYGGLGLPFKDSLYAAEVSGSGHSFSVAYGAHTGIGTLPILYYGNDEQRKKYLPKIITGEWGACYCLTEPGSGSDANSGKTKAVLTPDGKHYLINGQKMWITNGGFAQILTVFAKIDDDENLSAFIIEKGTEGLTIGAEEKKLGIKGSSTTQIFFNNVKVPVENLLYQRGKGFKIALNILNIGRIKLGIGVLGGCKDVLQYAIKYAIERQQFGRSISKYGAIRSKLAEQAIKIYAAESVGYRIGGNIEDAINFLQETGTSKSEAILKGIEQYALECALVKVQGSEVLDYCCDESLQVYGGMGYSSEMPVERAYRDARINRIFEGTNEINRMLIVEMLLKKAMTGKLDLMTPAMAVAGELTSIPDFDVDNSAPFAQEKRTVANFKKAVLMIAGAAAQKLMQTLAKEQEILMFVADMIIDTYASESTLLRVEKATIKNGEANTTLELDILRTFLVDASDRIAKNGKDAINAFTDGDELRMMLMGLKRFTKMEPFNTKQARQNIAVKLIEEGKYCF
jgi:alkylation response protein AidB-like acyl-CoA dehydrogenase